MINYISDNMKQEDFLETKYLFSKNSAQNAKAHKVWMELESLSLKGAKECFDKMNAKLSSPLPPVKSKKTDSNDDDDEDDDQCRLVLKNDFRANKL